jgi:hypothetical protein
MVTLSDGKVILFGGEDDAQNMYNDLFAYDSGQWNPITVINTPPQERKNQSAWFFDGKVYIHGGVGKNSQPFDDLWRYDPTTGEWVEVQIAGNKPSARRKLSNAARQCTTHVRPECTRDVQPSCTNNVQPSCTRLTAHLPHAR